MSSMMLKPDEAIKQLKQEISQDNEERYHGEEITTHSVAPSYNLETSNFEMPQKRVIEKHVKDVLKQNGNQTEFP